MTPPPSEAASLQIMRLDNVQVSLPIYHAGSRSLKKSLLFRGSSGRISRDASDRITIEALRGISLSLQSGDRLALIGHNGAGKTTLLRVMAGIYEPDVGSISVRGRISPMFDIGLGIDTDLSGFDNIRIRGMILGMSPAEIEEHLPDIAEFTELGEYLEMPVRTYSSGMLMKLTFGIATCFEPEVLLMDEWILAGDAHFMVKAQRRIESFVRKANVMVLATHQMNVCREWCNLGLWLDQGIPKAFGPIEEVIGAYEGSANYV
ncbi:lipopolysaccharide transport system ATP-binding protein [Tardiphaga sp. OK246]|uniref:ABC transporter ATP-binding protein n=1 Tax=Tardiphaga sp. OK246 TaxID=1855307 RepID=UPI000B6A43D0|nr:ABC transporter ATP-binding protein [Tardiphaga sp. OK246]SNT63928.1 lipopolysaccharide transport system ATP-binding protein [Tardiphaga sp. OK246]